VYFYIITFTLKTFNISLITCTHIFCVALKYSVLKLWYSYWRYETLCPALQTHKRRTCLYLVLRVCVGNSL